MLLHYASLSWLHFVFAFILVSAIAAEAFILRLPVDGRVARLLLRVDLFYAIAAGLVILAGVSRVLWGEKGWEYYQAQPFFWAKIATFLVIGLISIGPTRTFMRWVKAANADPAFAVGEADAKKVRRLVTIEAHLIALLLLFATLMARGIGS
jgi:putative membrane protein